MTIFQKKEARLPLFSFPSSSTFTRYTEPFSVIVDEKEVLAVGATTTNVLFTLRERDKETDEIRTVYEKSIGEEVYVFINGSVVGVDPSKVKFP